MDFLNKGICVGKLFYQMGWNPCFALKLFHEVVGHAVVYLTFSSDGAFLKAVERSRIILVGYYAFVFLLRRKDLLCLSLIHLFFLHNPSTSLSALRTLSLIAFLSLFILSFSESSLIAMISAANIAAFFAPFMAMDATGIPGGI